MKSFIRILVGGSCLLPLLASEIGLLPQEKTAIVVDAAERNPFGLRTVLAPEKVEETGGEEKSIRDAIGTLPVGGVVGTPPNARVLLGSMALSEGKELPAVIDNQSERLRVVSITEKQIEIAFLEKNGKESERRITVALNVKPSVRYMLGSKTGTTGVKKADKSKLGGMTKADEAVDTEQ